MRATVHRMTGANGQKTATGVYSVLVSTRPICVHRILPRSRIPGASVLRRCHLLSLVLPKLYLAATSSVRGKHQETHTENRIQTVIFPGAARDH